MTEPFPAELTPSRGRGKGDAIVTFSPWDTWRDARVREFCRPPDQLCKSLAESDRVERLLVADPWRSLPIDVVRRLQGRRAGFPSSVNQRHVRPLGLRRRDPVDLAAIRLRYRRYGGVLQAEARAMGMREPALVTFNPFVAAFSPLEWCRPVVYYGRDDWTAFGRNARIVNALREAAERMQERGVTVCAVSRVLADRVAGPGRGVVIPNGVDESVWSEPAPPPAAMRELPRPCGAYAGTVDNRLDVDALRELARSQLLASIAVIGPVGDPDVGRQLAARQGIHLLGALGQRDLVGALMAADVCLLPHAVTPLTQAMSPLKLYEYLASGSPVVATDLPPVRDVDPRVRLVSDGDYATAVKAALADGRLDEPGRIAFVQANSWRQRHERLLDLMFPE